MTWIKASWQDFVLLLRRSKPYLIILGLITTFLLIFELPSMVVVIRPGETGVLFKMFGEGTVTDYLYPEGIHVIPPWDTITIYNERIQESGESLSVLTQEGLEVQIDLSIRYHPEPTMIGVLHQTVGPDYVHKVAIPEVESAVRTSVGNLTIEQLYRSLTSIPGADTTAPLPGGSASAPPSVQPGVPAVGITQTQTTTATGTGTPNSSAASGGVLVAGTIAQPLAQVADASLLIAINKAIDLAAKKYVLIDDVLITRIKLPDYVQASIEKKIEQEQVAEAQYFLLDQSKSEVQIAQQKATANNVINASLTPQLLKLRGIEATEKIAASPNSKVVMVGNGASSLPVILGSDK